ncbi:hypothetical protein HAZT_HAZT004521 [Hyalella azteca]|uniref:Uncharacterized protein n=1 Tax=Hyalella azteca TaxID=294128 RepID=A0A6A0GRN2_HYAAZ|nr:hypothetical protein HAZT_HAZT004521 [Hyalella azteca]
MKVVRHVRFQEIFAQEKITRVDSLSLVLSGRWGHLGFVPWLVGHLGHVHWQVGHLIGARTLAGTWGTYPGRCGTWGTYPGS